MEERIGERINSNRTAEAIGTGADQIAVGCPFCRVMLSDGLTAAQASGTARDEVEVLDVAQMLLAAVKAPTEPPTKPADTSPPVGEESLPAAEESRPRQTRVLLLSLPRPRDHCSTYQHPRTRSPRHRQTNTRLCSTYQRPWNPKPQRQRRHHSSTYQRLTRWTSLSRPHHPSHFSTYQSRRRRTNRISHRIHRSRSRRSRCSTSRAPAVCDSSRLVTLAAVTLSESEITPVRSGPVA